MLFHLSIDADDPRRIAHLLAELLGGEALPFPPVSGGWVALAGDERSTLVEVYPRGTLLFEVKGDHDAESYVDEFAGWVRGSATHFAIATRLTLDRVLAIAEREGVSAKYRRRADAFGVIELWLEGEQMIEVLTPDMQAEYIAAMSPAGYRALLARGEQRLAA
jgi:hypothetical protein